MPPGGTAGSAIAPLLLPFIRLEQVLGRGVGVEDVGFHARGAAGGALYLVLLGVLELLNAPLTAISFAAAPPRVSFVSLGTRNGGVGMIIRKETAIFVWRCPDCSGVYDGESILFLYTDGACGYCTCGGRLIED